MQHNFATALELVLQHEGGWSDHPRDPGGATMKGVTLAVFRQHYGAMKTKDDLRHITPEQIANIYRKGYWDLCHCDDLPAGIDYATFDAAVNSGPSRAIRWLQRAAGVTQDGIIGPGTLDRLRAKPLADTINAMLDGRRAFLWGLSTWSTFGKGWASRVAAVRTTALTMAKAKSRT